MAFSFLPTVMVDSITQLTPEYLTQRGIRLLMLDFDNTIVPYTTNIPQPEMEQWLRRMAASQAPRICVVSNSKKDRVRHFCREYGLDCITHAKKPFHRGIRECQEKYGLRPEDCALAGDQIYTDVLGARSAGMQAILVQAIHNHTFWLKLRHAAEMPFILAARGRRAKF